VLTWSKAKQTKTPGVRKMPKVEQSKIGLPELDLCFLYTSVSCLPNPENCKFWTILTCDVLGDTLEPAPLCADFWNFQCLTRSRRCCFGTPQHTKRQRMYNGTELTLSQAQDFQYFTFYLFYFFFLQQTEWNNFHRAIMNYNILIIIYYSFIKRFL